MFSPTTGTSLVATQPHISVARCDTPTTCELCLGPIAETELLTLVPAFRTSLPVCLACSTKNAWLRPE